MLPISHRIFSLVLVCSLSCVPVLRAQSDFEELAPSVPFEWLQEFRAFLGNANDEESDLPSSFSSDDEQVQGQLLIEEEEVPCNTAETQPEDQGGAVLLLISDSEDEDNDSANVSPGVPTSDEKDKVLPPAADEPTTKGASLEPVSPQEAKTSLHSALWQEIKALTVKKAVLLATGTALVSGGAYWLYSAIVSYLQEQGLIEVTPEQYEQIEQFKQAIAQQDTALIEQYNVRSLPTHVAEQMRLLQQEYALFATADLDKQEMQDGIAHLCDEVDALLGRTRMVINLQDLDLPDQEEMEALFKQMLTELAEQA